MGNDATDRTTEAEQQAPLVEKCRQQARSLLTVDKDYGAAGLLFAAADTIEFQAQLLDRHLDDLAFAAKGKPAAPSKRRANGEHRHKFGADGKCTVPGCTHVKSAGGRPRREAARPDAEARTVPMPIVNSRPELAGADAADRYAGGGMGSSSAGDRR